ncbi:IPT/TIG domain-containing protein [Streptomyces sp. NPDC058646]|uniref:IPT/TIG domain-containing protein n=1 Tax=Streptomyces sp. NPDC058646 TaxID=3346574 RepID=UPI003660794C
MRHTARSAGQLFGVVSLVVSSVLFSAAVPSAAVPGDVRFAARTGLSCPGTQLCPPEAGPGDPGDPVGEVVSVTPDAGPRSGGFTVTLAGTGLTPYTRVLFGVLDDQGCFVGQEAPDAVVLSDTTVVATAPAWPSEAGVSVVAATPDGRFTAPLAFTYLD